MERDRFGEPLSVGMLVVGAPRVEAAVALAIADAGHRVAGTITQADLLILLIDSSAPNIGRNPSGIGQGRPVPSFAFVNTAVPHEDQAWLTETLHEPRSVVTYEGVSDLRWKVAQTLAGYLSSCFRESLHLQRSMLDSTKAPNFESLTALAVHSDVQTRRLATRLIAAYLDRTPDGAEPLATALLATGNVGSFSAAAQVLRLVERADPDRACTLLSSLIRRSPAFLTWLLDRDS